MNSLGTVRLELAVY